MRNTQAVAALVALTSYVAATPITELQGKTQFSLPQVAAGKRWKNGAVDLQKAYLKYKAPVPAHLAEAARVAQGQQGSVTATPESYDEAYLIPVTCGSTTLNLDLDTGSADLWVFSTLQPKSQTSGHTLYPLSGTRENGETWDIEYGDGSSASGVVYADKVVVGGVTATQQAVEAATSVSSEFVSDPSNGLIGMAFSSINTVSPNQATTFFDTVKSTLNAPLFAAGLKYHANGVYDIGYIDSSKYTGSITYTSVNSGNGFWQFTASGYSVGSGATKSSSLSCIADTGTTLALLPQAVLTAYYSQVSGAQNSNSAGGYIFPCSSTLPNLNIIINGYKAVVPGKYINYAPYSGSYCYGGLQSSAGIGFNILGDIFLKSQYVVFQNNGNPTIGFAATVNP